MALLIFRCVLIQMFTTFFDGKTIQVTVDGVSYDYRITKFVALGLFTLNAIA